MPNFTQIEETSSQNPSTINLIREEHNTYVHVYTWADI